MVIMTRSLHTEAPLHPSSALGYLAEYLVTNSETIRSTVYETKTVTSTITRDGTVLYVPSPL